MKKNTIMIILVGIIVLSIYGCGNKGKAIEESLEAIEVMLEESEETYRTPEQAEVQQTEDDKGTDPIYIIEPGLTRDDTYEMQDWQAAYAEYIEDFEWKERCDYSLIYVDEDDIPELVIDTRSGAGGCHILTFHNGVTDVLETWRTGFAYIEKGNLLNNSSGNMGLYYDRIHSIENGKWVYVTGGEIRENPENRMEFLYEWEGEPIEEEEYEEKLAEVFDREQAVEPEQYERLDEMLFRLQMGTALSQTHRYELYVEDVTWDEAQRRCEEKGGYLATITTIEEYVHIRKGIEDSGQTQVAYWVGAYDDNLLISGGLIYEWYEPNRDVRKYFFISSSIMGKYWADGEPSYFKQASDEQIDELGIYLLYDDVKENCYLYDAPMDMLLRNPEYTGRIGYICEYDSVTVMSKETHYSADGSISSWEEYEYDDTGNLTKQISHNADGSIKRWREYEYDNAKNQTKMTMYDSYGKSSVMWEKEYDSAGNMKKEINYRIGVGGSVDSGWKEYEYDSAGNMTKCIGYDAGGNVEWRYECGYDSAGSETKRIRYSADDSIDWWDEYEYDSAGNKTKGTVYNADGSIRSWHEREYDNEGYETKYIGYDANGTIVEYYEYVNVYDNYGNMIEKSVYFDNGWKDSWHEYEYNASGVMIRAIGHHSNGEITEVEYDNTGKIIKSFWYDGDFIIDGTEWEYDYMGNLTKYTDYRWDEVREWKEYEYMIITL